MKSDKDWLMVFGCALYIIADQNRQSIAFADNAYWVHPQNTGNLMIDKYGELDFAGGDNRYFRSVDVEVWGLH